MRVFFPLQSYGADENFAQIAGSPIKRLFSNRGSTRQRHPSESDDVKRQDSGVKRQASEMKKGESQEGGEADAQTITKKILTKAEKEELWDKDIPEVCVDRLQLS